MSSIFSVLMLCPLLCMECQVECPDGRESSSEAPVGTPALSDSSLERPPVAADATDDAAHSHGRPNQPPSGTDSPSRRRIPTIEYSGEGFDLLKEFESSRVPMKLANIPTWQAGEWCGLNCLYALVRLTTPGISYDRLVQAAGPVPPGGFSLDQLKEIAQEVGSDVRIIKCQPSELTEMEPPVVVHIGESGQEGHFICLVRRQDDTLICVDGTTGGQFTVGESGTRPLPGLLRQASGYMMLPARSTAASLSRARWKWGLRGSACVMLLLACALTIASRSRRPRTPLP